MAIGNLNYTSSQINTLLNKGNQLVSPDVTNLVLKTTASSTYITSSDMSNTYQYGTNYVLQSTLSSNGCTTSNWNSYYNTWSGWLSSIITRIQKIMYPVGSVYLNWYSSGSTPSFGTWQTPNTKGIILVDTSSDALTTSQLGTSDKTMTSSNNPPYSYTCTTGAPSNTFSHYHVCSSAHAGVAMAASSVTFTMDQGWISGGSGTTYYLWNGRTSTAKFNNTKNATAATTCVHSHSYIIPSHSPTSTINVRQPGDAIGMWVRTA